MSEIVFYSLITILSAALFLGVTIYIKRTVEDFFKVPFTHHIRLIEKTRDFNARYLPQIVHNIL